MNLSRWFSHLIVGVVTVCFCVQTSFSLQTSGSVIARLTMPPGSVATEMGVEVTLSGSDRPFATASTGPNGLVVFPSLPAGEYDLRLVGGGILRKGFRVFTSRESDLENLVIDQVGDSPSGGVTTNRFESAAEVSTVITTQQVERVPVLGRNPIQLVSTLAGAGFTTRTSTTISGLRPGYAGVSLDGVNIQDHY